MTVEELIKLLEIFEKNREVLSVKITETDCTIEVQKEFAYQGKEVLIKLKG